MWEKMVFPTKKMTCGCYRELSPALDPFFTLKYQPYQLFQKGPRSINEEFIPSPKIPMRTTRPHLSIYRPSPTTVSFTVSTASPHRTLTSHLLHHLSLLLRTLLCLATLTILYLGLFTAPHPSLRPLSALVSQYPTSHILALSFIALFLVFRRFHTGTSPIAVLPSV